jgi:hypothetical protein
VRKNQDAPHVLRPTDVLHYRAKLDADVGTVQTIAKATLSGHTMLSLLGTQVKLVGVPQQWLKNANTPGSAKRARHDHGETVTSNGEGPTDSMVGGKVSRVRRASTINLRQRQKETQSSRSGSICNFTRGEWAPPKIPDGAFGARGQGGRV